MYPLTGFRATVCASTEDNNTTVPPLYGVIIKITILTRIN